MDDTEKTNIYQQTSSPQGTIIPEEVSAEIERPEEISGSIPPDFPTDVPVYQESNNKWMFVIGAILFFLIVFGLIYWFFLRDLIQPLKPPSSSTEDITLTYWGLWDEKDVFQPVIDDYQKKNQHITIAYEKMSSEQYRVRLLARSQTGNGPDIFRFHNTWLPEIQEVITAIPADIMTVEEFNAIFYPIHQKDLKINDQYYGIPLMVDGTVLIYNEDILPVSPSNGNIDVLLKGISGNKYQIKLTNVLGQVIVNKEVILTDVQQKISITDKKLATGMYYIIMQTENKNISKPIVIY